MDDIEERGVDFPDVVVEGNALDGGTLVLIEPGRACEHQRVRRHSAHVGAGLRVVSVYRVEECFECGSGDALAELFVVLAADGESDPGAESSESDEAGAGHRMRVWGNGWSWGMDERSPRIRNAIRGPRRGAGDGLLSRALSGGVPLALQGLTTVFGMGTGVAPAL